MAIKVRVLYFSNKGKMISLADAICAKIDCKSDAIPPAYPCENERLVIIGASVGKEIPNALRLFCAGLNKSRAHNVAFYIDGPKEAAAELKSLILAAGANPIDDVHFCNGGLPLKFMKKISEEERSGIVAWATKIHAELSK
jgi:hypothetical protein